MASKNFILLILFLAVLGFSCKRKVKETGGERPATEPVVQVIIPEFNADSALAFVKAQTDFGPRVPGSKAHADCANYLKNTLLKYSPDVKVQEFKARIYNGNVLSGKNIIASFQPQKKARIVLCAHWDSRPYGDHDPDPAKHDKPIDGANDGASGVGVLLEVARLLANTQTNIGIDIIFFDLEDYGPPQDSQVEGNENWGLGSQYWSKNPHVPAYFARYCILLDMVGAPNARFLQEGFSMYYAPDIVSKVWNIAQNLGYHNYFVSERGSYINDDHYFVNILAKIPAIDIIHLDPNSSNGTFFEYWHTAGDTFDKIDKTTLGVVGDVVVNTIYKEK